MNLRDALYGDHDDRRRKPLGVEASAALAARLAQDRAHVRELVQAEHGPDYRFRDERREAAAISLLEDLDGSGS